MEPCLLVRKLGAGLGPGYGDRCHVAVGLGRSMAVRHCGARHRVGRLGTCEAGSGQCLGGMELRQQKSVIEVRSVSWGSPAVEGPTPLGRWSRGERGRVGQRNVDS